MTMSERLSVKGIVPVVVLDDEADAEQLAGVLMEAGLDVIEITFRTAAARASISRIARKFPEMMVGAGTLLTPQQVREAYEAGASFGLAPGLNAAVIAAAHDCGLAFAPGVNTPTEIERALELDCDLLKFFPAEASGGVAALEALSGPYSGTGVKMVPTGGIDVTNLAAYRALPIVAAVGGTWMVERRLIREKRWDEIRRLTMAALVLAERPSGEFH